MKVITAIVHAHRAHAVRAALEALGVDELYTGQVTRSRRVEDRAEVYRALHYRVESTPRARIEAAVEDEDVAEAVRVISASSSTGRAVDVRVWVSPVYEPLAI